MINQPGDFSSVTVKDVDGMQAHRALNIWLALQASPDIGGNRAAYRRLSFRVFSTVTKESEEVLIRLFVPTLFPKLLWLNPIHVDAILDSGMPAIACVIAGYNHPASMRAVLAKRPIELNKEDLRDLDRGLRRSTAHARSARQMNAYFLALMPLVPLDLSDELLQVCSNHGACMNYHDIMLGRTENI